MKRKITLIVSISIVVIASVAIVLNLTPYDNGETIKSNMFSELRSVREDSKHAVLEYVQSVHDNALEIQSDEKMQEYFCELMDSGGIADRYLEFEIDLHYVNNYGNFYDILFVDKKGYVFHSIKQESDYHTNIFEGKLADSKLSRRLREDDDFFVEYDNYEPSGEPSAFFAFPVAEDSCHEGWFVLQTASNRINDILSGRKWDARTGEVYLVNKERLMVSDSRFIEDSTILSQIVDTDAVREAIAVPFGEKIIEDYRGVRVFSSFERFKVFNSEWIIIAEIDEDEVLTEYYKKQKKHLLDRICQDILKTPRVGVSGRVIPAEYLKVDMNEYGKVTGENRIHTYGISTCTGVVIHYPERFGYLVHIAALDEIYPRTGIADRLFSKAITDVLGNIISRMFFYNLYHNEVSNLRFMIVAPHKESLERTVDKFLENDVSISQIKFVYNPDAISANIYMDMSDNSVLVNWTYKDYAAMEDVADITDLGSLVKSIIGYDMMEPVD